MTGKTDFLYYKCSFLSNYFIRSFLNAVLIMIVKYGRLYICLGFLILSANRPVLKLAVKTIYPNNKAMSSFDTFIKRPEYFRQLFFIRKTCISYISREIVRNK
jgi:hypothetical protein